MPGSPAPMLHVSGVVLPDGERADLWVADGLIRRSAPAAMAPLSSASAVATRVAATGWVLPGLVDMHCHIGLDRHGAVPPETAQEQAISDRDAGVLLIRDAGSPSDTRWIDAREDLPRIIRAGRHLARTGRYIRNYGHEIEPDQLAAYVRAQAQLSDGWVKLVGDWIDRDSGDLAPCWPRWAIDEAIAAAHECGARVTAHVFGEEALPDLIGAGIDCIEHGTGLSTDLLNVMAANRVALVPTLINIANFPSFATAGEAKFPAYAQHMRDLHARRYDVIGAAHEAGVLVLAGTDAGGNLAHGQVGAEVLELIKAGIPPVTAVGAASWRAREFLGRPAGLADGDPADFIVLDADPVVDPTTLRRPTLVVLRGRVVAGAERRR